MGKSFWRGVRFSHGKYGTFINMIHFGHDVSSRFFLGFYQIRSCGAAT